MSAKIGAQIMSDRDQADLTTANTQRLPDIRSAPKNEEAWRIEQERINEMIESRDPLSKILSELVLMIERQSPEMLCSILLLSEDGDHVKHAVAPSLPENYVKVIDGSPIGPKH